MSDLLTKTMMDQSVKALWIDKLRNTPVKNRGREWMKRHGKYCPYGVLYELAADLGIIRQDWGPHVTDDMNMHGALADWAGFADWRTSHDRLPSLGNTYINRAWDSGKYSWETITNAIEKDM